MSNNKPNERKGPVTVDAASFAEAAIRRNEWDVEVDFDVTIADIQKPEFWSHVASKLRKWDRIEVRHCAGMWLAELVVRSAGPVWANVVLLKNINFQDAKIPEDIEKSPYKVEFVRSSGWRVMRKSDNRIIQANFGTVAEASNYVRDNLLIAAA